VAQAALTIRVIDQNGIPVPDAVVRGSFEYTDYESDPYRQISNTNGIVSVSGRLMGIVNIIANKDGYYESVDVFRWKNKFHGAEIKEEKWQPWNPTIELILKEVTEPIPLFVRNVDRMPIPEKDKPIGFDLFEADWVPPYGAGKYADMFITATVDYRAYQDMDVQCSISFSNQYDGLIRFEAEKYGSTLKSKHRAPVEGYETVFSWAYGNSPDKERYSSTDSKYVNYYSRIRTVVNEDGHIVKAFYGKIYGGVRFSARQGKPAISFQYYLNPKSLDKNVEYDVKHNLAIPDNASPKERRHPKYFANRP
jgi:hypothetical protein